MLEFVETILAFIGLLTVLEATGVAFRGSEAAAHREGLDSATRISAAAFEAEHALHHAAREAERRAQ